MLMKSYSQKYEADGVDYRAQATGINGYQISMDGGATWKNFTEAGAIKNDSQYIIYTENSKTEGMWLASTSSSYHYYLMAVLSDGTISYSDYGYDCKYIGFRPVVCLNSNVTLKQVTGGYEIQ